MHADPRPQTEAARFARTWASRLLLAVNLALFVALLGLILGRGAAFSPPWDGPAVATVALTAAAIVLAAVGIGVGLLAVWGTTTLRDHAARVAGEAASQAADRQVQQLLRDWGLSPAPGSGEDVARAYEKE